MSDAKLSSDQVTTVESLAARGISVRAPADELERQLAIIVCRMNCYLHPLDGVPMTHKPRTGWGKYGGLVDHEVFLWMWNLGRDQWRT